VKVERISWYIGQCPFVTCGATTSHGHLMCPTCGAVRFGNGTCETCRAAWGGSQPDADAFKVIPVTMLRQIARSIRCPFCGAGPGERCRKGDGTARHEHRVRRQLAATEHARLGGDRIG
jgi:hypothetical protein